MVEMTHAYLILVGKSDERRAFAKPGHRWEDNIKMEVRCAGSDWIHLAQHTDQWEAYTNKVMNLGVS
jgi:hypothetical protein